MQNFKETDKMAQPVIEKPVQSDEFQLLKRISISREKDIEFLQKSLKNIIVVKSYDGPKFAIYFCSPVHGQQQPKT